MKILIYEDDSQEYENLYHSTITFLNSTDLQYNIVKIILH